MKECTRGRFFCPPGFESKTLLAGLTQPVGLGQAVHAGSSTNTGSSNKTGSPNNLPEVPWKPFSNFVSEFSVQLSEVPTIPEIPTIPKVPTIPEVPTITKVPTIYRKFQKTVLF